MTAIRITKADREQAAELNADPAAVAKIRAKHGREKVQKLLGVVSPPQVIKPAFARSSAFTIWTEAAEPILIVIRKMASAAHVLCRLKGTETKDLVCDVRVSANFRKGMEIPGAKKQPQHNSRAWKYLGRLPRVPGRW